MARARVPQERLTLCTSCDRPLRMDVSAKSVSCPGCNNRVICEPMVVKDYIAVRHLKVANHIHITKKAIVVANVRADDLEIDGRQTGNIVSLQGVVISRKAKVLGDVRALWLEVEEGATLVGRMAVGPDQMPELEVVRQAAQQPAKEVR